VLPAGDPSTFAVDEVLRFCRERLSGARLPKSLSVSPSPFRDPSGKVRRQLVASACATSSEPGGGAPRYVRFD